MLVFLGDVSGGQLVVDGFLVKMALGAAAQHGTVELCILWSFLNGARGRNALTVSVCTSQ